MDLHIQRPISLSIIYHVRPEVYNKLLETCGKYCYTGLNTWQALADNYSHSKLPVDVMQSLLSDHGLLDRVSFSPIEINEFLYGGHDYMGEKTVRDWSTVYRDLVDAGMKNRGKKDLMDNEVNWVLDGKIINLEPAEPPVL